MAKFVGRRVPVGIALEASRGTGVVPTHVLAKTDYSLDDKANMAVSGEGIGSISGKGNLAVVTAKFSEGGVDFEAEAKSLPIVLKAVFGGLATAAAGTGYKQLCRL